MKTRTLLEGVTAATVAFGMLWIAPSAVAAPTNPVFKFAWGTEGIADGQFNAPVDVATNTTTGYVYVADDANNRVQEFSSRGSYVNQWSVYNPVAVAVDSVSGSVYISSLGSGSIYVISPSSTISLFAAGFDEPEGVAVNSESGDVYILNTYASQIDVYTSNGSLLNDWGSEGGADGELQVPLGIAVNQLSGNVYVSDTGNSRIEEFTSSGAYVTQWNGCDYCRGLTVDGKGHVYVAQNYGENIDKYTSSGNLLVSWGTLGTQNGQFEQPSGVALYKKRIYVADGGNNRIDVFRKFRK